MTAVFATLGFGVSIALIAAGGGFEVLDPTSLTPHGGRYLESWRSHTGRDGPGICPDFKGRAKLT